MGRSFEAGQGQRQGRQQVSQLFCSAGQFDSGWPACMAIQAQTPAALTPLLGILRRLSILGLATGGGMLMRAVLQGRNGAHHCGMATASGVVVATALLGAASHAGRGLAAGHEAANERIDQLGACRRAAGGGGEGGRVPLRSRLACSARAQERRQPHTV